MLVWCTDGGLSVTNTAEMAEYRISGNPGSLALRVEMAG
jgi:hypothetical protein